MTSFLDLHRPGDPLLLPNPWDVGSARLLRGLGFRALATTSSGLAATLGREDMTVTRDEALAHAAAVAAAVDVPVSADLEKGFADDPDGVADTVRRARDAGLAGCSIEDATGDADAPVFDTGLAVERVAAAVEAAGDGFVVTARAENLLHGRDDPAGVADALDRLARFAAVGAHVLYAPGLARPEHVRDAVAIGPPVNVLVLESVPPVAELAALGVARVSVGGAFLFAAWGGLVAAATEFRDAGTYGFRSAAAAGRGAAELG